MTKRPSLPVFRGIHTLKKPPRNLTDLGRAVCPDCRKEIMGMCKTHATVFLDILLQMLHSELLILGSYSISSSPVLFVFLIIPTGDGKPPFA